MGFDFDVRAARRYHPGYARIGSDSARLPVTGIDSLLLLDVLRWKGLRLSLRAGCRGFVGNLGHAAEILIFFFSVHREVCI